MVGNRLLKALLSGVLTFAIWGDMGKLSAETGRYSISEKAYSSLKVIYDRYCKKPSDINAHLPMLRTLAGQCNSAAEIGIRNLVSTWAILLGLSRPAAGNNTYIGIDIAAPADEKLSVASHLAEFNGIDFHFWHVDDMTITLPSVDFLFIDSLHTYCHLTFELETFASSVNKYIAMHDTSAPWGYADDSKYKGNYSEYPEWIDRSKRGLWAAVQDFLVKHPEWELLERRTNNNGLTVLRRRQ